MTPDGSTVAPKIVVATSATSCRCSSSVPAPARVADVPTYWIRGARLPADPADEQGDVGALPAAIRVELVEDQEPEVGGGLDQPPLPRAREEQLEHHVVSQQDVGRVRDDRLALFVVLLARVPRERDRSLAIREART